MDTVEAVKTKEDIQLVGHLLKKYGGDLYADIWKIGINLSLRISDLLSIRFSDLDIDNRILKLKEQKTGKNKEVRLNNTVIEIIKNRINQFPDDTYLFQVHSNRSKNKPISRHLLLRN